MVSTRPQGRTLPVRGARTRPRYRELDTDTDDEVCTPHQASQSSRPSRSARSIRTYRETSESDNDEEDSSSPSASDREAVKSRSLNINDGRALRTAAGTSRPQKRTRDQVTTRSGGRQSNLDSLKRQKLGAPRPANKSTVLATISIAAPKGGRFPPWQELPYLVLVQIMQYAAYPLYSSSTRSNSSIHWLVLTSRMCKSFHDSAMAALLLSPPLYPPYRAHGLIEILSSALDDLALNYQDKIHALDIEVNHLLIRKSGISLEELLQHTPLVSNLRIYHAHDEMIGKAIWANPSRGRAKWMYGDLFRILNRQNIKLQTFEWNGRFQDTIPQMLEAHRMLCMHGLKHLTVVNLMFGEKEENERIHVRSIVSDALLQLPELRSLHFMNCNILDSDSMLKLPNNLNVLEITNSLSLTSDALCSYLEISGTTLTTLHLAGNQVMDLGFSARLRELCPRLQELYIDLTYEDSSSYNDRDPLYDALLPSGSPSWPTGLRSIIIGPLRSLSIQDAEEFYTSLFKVAASLTHLRTLSLKTFLKDASWRDRATMRSRWVPLFDKVFLANKNYTHAPVVQLENQTTILQRKSLRIRDLSDISVSESAEESEDNLPSSISGPLPKQNGCNIVEFELSDQRPAKDQYTEGDFLDDEPEDDGDWR